MDDEEVRHAPPSLTPVPHAPVPDPGVAVSPPKVEQLLPGDGRPCVRERASATVPTEPNHTVALPYARAGANGPTRLLDHARMSRGRKDPPPKPTQVVRHVARTGRQTLTSRQ